MSEQSREQFEAAYIARLRAGGFEGVVEFKREGHGYANFFTDGAWWGWQASRQAIEVELPSRDRIRNEDMAYYHADVCSSIESCGLRVKA